MKVEFMNSRKEIWCLEDEMPSNKVEAEILAGRISYRLERDGSWIIRGTKAIETLPVENQVRIGLTRIKIPPRLPFGNTRLIYDRATPLAAKIISKVIQPVSRLRRPARVSPTKIRVDRGMFGLGSKGMRRLRSLFENTLLGLGIDVTRAMKSKANEVIFQLDTKYKLKPRDQALEGAVTDLLKWIEKDFYLKRF